MAVKVAGTNDVIRALRAFGGDVKKMVIDQIEDSATNIELRANLNKRRAIRNKSAKLSFITIDKVFSKGGLRAVVGIQGENKLAAYFEFGTGVSARWILAPYPQEIKDIAMQFYISGKGTLRGQPFLFPAWLTERPKLEQALKEILEEAVRKYNK